jgi:uncharacterized membrane protein YhaH (DUF805 family)
MTTQGSAGASALLVQLAPLMVVMLLLVVPFVRILRRAGRSGWWVLLLFIPGFGWLVMPWVIAFMRWERPPEELEQVFR